MILDLRNFQLHKRKRIALEPITVIIGPNDSGKSSIVRALQWLALNQPNSSRFIRHGSKFVKVGLSLDGVKVVRKKGDGKNTYLINGKRLAAVGSSVPDEVRNLLRMGEENFQDQHSLPFWFSDTPGQVSKNLNKVVDLSTIDKALANIASQVRTNRTEIEISRNRLREAKSKQSELSYVPDLVNDYRALETQQEHLQEMRNGLRILEHLLANAAQLKETKDRASAAGVDGGNMLSIAEKLRAASDNRSKLSGLVAQWSRLETEIAKLRKEASEQQQEIERKSGGRCPICGRNLTKENVS